MTAWDDALTNDEIKALQQPADHARRNLRTGLAELTAHSRPDDATGR